MNQKIFSRIIIALIFSVLLCNLKIANAQVDSMINISSKYIKPPFVSDGQYYKALLNHDEAAEFKITFFGNTTYRVVGFSGKSEGNLIFTLYDTEHNYLFSNKNYKNSPYWDFKFTSTVECIVEARLANPKTSGYVLLFIGFKR